MFLEIQEYFFKLIGSIVNNKEREENQHGYVFNKLR